MNIHNSATDRRVPAILNSGLLHASLGVLAFSFSFPATVWAMDSFGPWSVTGLRGIVAAVLSLAALAIFRVKLPNRRDWPALTIVAAGSCLGFPLLTALALQTTSSGHSAVVIGLLPMATAAIATLITGIRQTRAFWVASSVGAITVVTFTLIRHGGGLRLGDLFLFGAVLACGLGYAYGGFLAVTMSGWQVIAWGNVIALPVNLTVIWFALGKEAVHLSAEGVFGLLYVAGVSQFLGFVVWYSGMAKLGVTQASQIQLAQPILTVFWSILFLKEAYDPLILVAAAIVIVCIAVTQRVKK